jgi:uncharacterized protein YaeQ
MWVAPVCVYRSAVLYPESSMALKSAVFKASLQVADMDRGYYADHALTLARHPSETDERMMVRLLAFALHADAALEFGKGLSSDEEPDLWRRDLTGTVELWIEVGEPDPKWIRKACGRARQVVVLSYGGRSADVWWEQNRGGLTRMNTLTVLTLPALAARALAKLAARNMRLQCTIQDGQIWLSDGQDTVYTELTTLQSPVMT